MHPGGLQQLEAAKGVRCSSESNRSLPASQAWDGQVSRALQLLQPNVRCQEPKPPSDPSQRFSPAKSPPSPPKPEKPKHRHVSTRRIKISIAIETLLPKFARLGLCLLILSKLSLMLRHTGFVINGVWRGVLWGHHGALYLLPLAS